MIKVIAFQFVDLNKFNIFQIFHFDDFKHKKQYFQTIEEENVDNFGTILKILTIYIPIELKIKKTTINTAISATKKSAISDEISSLKKLMIYLNFKILSIFMIVNLQQNHSCRHL